MKTAEEIYIEVQDAECPNINNLILPDEWQIHAMKVYAKQVTEQVLKDAANNAKYVPYLDEYVHEKSCIESTPIKLP